MATLGDILKAEREKRGESCSEVAAQTHVKIQHIEALERNDFSHIAAPAYAKGFIRLYADHLGLDPAPLVAEYSELHAPRDQAATLIPDEVPRSDEEDEENQGPGLGERIVAVLADVPWGRIAATLAILVVAWLAFTGLGRFAKSLLQAGPVDTVASSAPAPHALLREPPAPYLSPDRLEPGQP